MSTRPWIYINNTFEVNTRTSHKKMLTLATDTHSKLTAQAADAGIAAILALYNPVFSVYEQLYANYEIASGNRQGETLNVETLMRDNLPLNLRLWEAAVRIVYPEDSPQEKAIFPNKRTPFLQGTYETRISAINTLVGKLQTDPAFAALVPQVQSFYNLVHSARDTQQQKEGLLDSLSSTRENQRVLLAQELYGAVLGGLMGKYKANPGQITDYFDLTLLRAGEGETILDTKQGVVAAGMRVNLGALPEGTTQVRMKALAGGPLEFGLSADGLNFNGNTTAMSAGAETTYSIADFASIGTTFVVFNQNGSTQGEYLVEFIG